MKFIRWVLYTKWKVIRTTWPYPEGYGTYRKNRWNGQITLLDSGLTKDQATEIAQQMNTVA